MTAAVDLSIGSKATVERRIFANTSLLLVAKIVAATLGLGTLIVASRALEPAMLGAVVFAHGYMLFFSEVGAFQSWQSIIRFGTVDVEERDIGRFGRLMKFAIKLDFVSALSSTVMAISLLGFALWLGQYLPLPERPGGGLDEGELQLYTSLYCLLILFRQSGSSIGVFRLFDKFTVLAFKNIIMPTLRFAGALFAAAQGWGVVGFLVVWFSASFLSYMFLPTMGFLELRRRKLWPHVWKAKASLFRPGREGLWAFAIKSNVDSTLSAANNRLPIILVTAFFGQAFAAVYKIAEEVAKLLSEGFRLLDQVIYPELARMVADGRIREMWRIVIRSSLFLLGMGVVLSVVVLVLGPETLARVFGEDFIESAPLAAVLVPAAALTGIVVPLFPLMFAAGRPERAIFSRSAGLVAYVVAFFGLSLWLGTMGAAWALVAGNAFTVAAGIGWARRTVREQLAGEAEEAVPAPRVEVVGSSGARIWGLPMEEWQRRTFRKAGADGGGTDVISVEANKALSPGLVRALVATPEVTLVDESGDWVATRTEKSDPLDPQIRTVTPDELAGSYDVALRRHEAPYILDMRRDDPDEVMRRQFASSYKGITDFVTKWVWPVPAYHVTRWLANRGVSPNQVTTVGLVLTVLAFWAFWEGHWWLGFASGWTMMFLDTVDGKLARTTMTYSKWGNVYDHGIDLIHPPFWYWAWWHGLGVSLAAQGLELPEWALLALVAILVGYVVDRLVEGWFIAQFGMHVHVWTRLNSALRFVIARRNPNTFIFMLGIMATVAVPTAGVWALGAVAVWTWVCIAVNFVSVLVAQFAPKPLVSWMETG